MAVSRPFFGVLSRRAILLAAAATALSGAAAYYSLLQTAAPGQPVVVPVRTAVTTIAALGRLEPAGEIVRLAAPTATEGTRLESLLIKVGDRVRAGQVVAVLDRRERLVAALGLAQVQVRQAQADLAQVEAGAKVGDLSAQRAAISRLEAELAIARAEHSRYSALFETGAISASQLDSKQLAVFTAEGQLKQARSALVALAEVRPTDLEAARAAVSAAQAGVRKAQADLNVAYVRSLRAGQVLEIHARPGEAIGSEGIAELGETAQMFAVAEVYETDIARIRPGQRATVSSANGAFTGRLPGTVSEVGRIVAKKDVLNTDPAADIDARVVEVKVRLDSAASRRVTDLTNLQVDVTIAL